MKRRIFLACALAASVAIGTAPASAEQLSLNAISSYLNDLSKAKGQFTQVNPDGSLSKGTFYLKRPGKMRFEYDAPNPSLVVAGSGVVAIYDKKSNTGPQEFPLSKTPLSIILAKQVNLSASGMVSKHRSDGVSTKVTAHDPKRPEIGNIQMVFTDSPTELRQWVVTDQSGKKTTVILGKLDENVNLPLSLFNVHDITEKLKRKR
ncbi:LolA family protein [Paramylibacter ulvae]|uniref:LolA family protein n=1 Tax=Paramylibacter ulvae TaxID=1651968 RepID=UPI00167A67CE|nr:outer membrane lipoprotein carrier protein LolA [Amylibacter ulvae]